MTFADAYHAGQIAGRVTIDLLLIAAAIVLVRRLSRGVFARGLRSRAATVVELVVVIVLMLGAFVSQVRPDQTAGAPGRPADTGSVAQARTEMLAGCTDQGAPRRYCECFSDHVLAGVGHDPARLSALEAELKRAPAGSQPPAVVLHAAQACQSLR